MYESLFLQAACLVRKCVKAWSNLWKLPPNILILHAFLSPSTARCSHMLDRRGISSFVFLVFSVTRKGCSTENMNIPNQGCQWPEHHEEQQNPNSLKWSHKNIQHLQQPVPQSPSHGKYPSFPISPHRCHLQLGHWKPIGCKKLPWTLQTGPKNGNIPFIFLVTFSPYKTGACIGNLAAKLRCENLYWAPAFP